MIKCKDLSDVRFHWPHWDCVSICAMLSGVPRSFVACHMPQVPYAQLFRQKICLLQDHAKLCQKVQRNKWAVCLCLTLNQLWRRTVALNVTGNRHILFLTLDWFNATMSHSLSLLLCSSILLFFLSTFLTFFLSVFIVFGPEYLIFSKDGLNKITSKISSNAKNDGFYRSWTYGLIFYSTCFVMPGLSLRPMFPTYPRILSRNHYLHMSHLLEANHLINIRFLGSKEFWCYLTVRPFKVKKRCSFLSHSPIHLKSIWRLSRCVTCEFSLRWNS